MAIMMLMTKAIKKAIPALYSGEETPLNDKICHVKFFDPCGSWTWYATEFDPETGMFFGWVDGSFPEWGNFMLSELEDYKGPLHIGIERDRWFKPKKMSEISDYQKKAM